MHLHVESSYVEHPVIAVQHFDPVADNVPVEHVVHLHVESSYVEHPLIVVQHFTPVADNVPVEHVEHLHVVGLYVEHPLIDGHVTQLHDVSYDVQPLIVVHAVHEPL